MKKQQLLLKKFKALHSQEEEAKNQVQSMSPMPKKTWTLKLEIEGFTYEELIGLLNRYIFELHAKPNVPRSIIGGGIFEVIKNPDITEEEYNKQAHKWVDEYTENKEKDKKIK